MDKPATLAMFTEALMFASRKHSSQRRKNGDIPYINHPIEVARILSQAGVQDFTVLCAAVLHDTIEDTETTADELESVFGSKIKTIVLECSDDKNMDKWERKLHQIRHAAMVSQEAKLVKIGDKLSNNWDVIKKPPGNWSPERIIGYHVWSYAVCKSLQGINEVLDKAMQELFIKAGVWGIEGEEIERRLDAYAKSF